MNGEAIWGSRYNLWIATNLDRIGPKLPVAIQLPRPGIRKQQGDRTYERVHQSVDDPLQPVGSGQY